MAGSSATSTARRAEWTAAATDYVLEHGLITLSLRPLGAALGTSDRMLLYHFGTKDHLVAAVMRASNDRACAAISALPGSSDVGAAVHDLWSAMAHPDIGPCVRMYVEAAALGLLGREPYASVVREANKVWTEAVVAHFVKSGARELLARRVADVVDAAFMGFQLDLPLDLDPADRAAKVADLAAAVVALAT
ncbi:MAG TPA: TetR/AcrR family transcriptional regulator [Nocardioides sp.]|nr:TetR/AcrR family transcriptional regulator [Nocardioides sp.]